MTSVSVNEIILILFYSHSYLLHFLIVDVVLELYVGVGRVHKLLRLRLAAVDTVGPKSAMSTGAVSEPSIPRLRVAQSRCAVLIVVCHRNNGEQS